MPIRNVNDLEGDALDWAAAVANGEDPNCTVDGWSPSTDWSRGGPLIEVARIETYYSGALEQWAAKDGGWLTYGPTPLIAAMRAYVKARLGETVAVPPGL